MSEESEDKILTFTDDEFPGMLSFNSNPKHDSAERRTTSLRSSFSSLEDSAVAHVDNNDIISTNSEDVFDTVLEPGSVNPEHESDAEEINVGAGTSQECLLPLPEHIMDSAELCDGNGSFDKPNEFVNHESDIRRSIVDSKVCGTENLNFHPRQRVSTLRTFRTSKAILLRRRTNREMAKLPMLACKDEFVIRLRSEKVLVVTAETGSGKTTQLPQYCAEEFPGLMICTQPRVIAAVSVAHRIAKEFDNGKVGGNVGYESRSGNKVRGRQIMIMTDAALIRMAQHDRLLKRVGVLIIDEAHERSLNTDIVVGIAKTVLRQRPKDFRVVIASATIDPKPFLEFFFDDLIGSSLPEPLTVPGRVFPVTTETRRFGNSEDFSGSLAKEVVKTLKKRTVGHCLVFLQGSREVDAAIASFKNLAQPNWSSLPLYGTLSPQDQNKVLTFDDVGGTLRMIVFCTNVAETSLTVPNVRLVIDTGRAKESRYDTERHMTILEEVYISKSSAEQRKGRAGRTAEGHCVRLFTPETLTRTNIEPEILRSSLDLVMLQICSLGFSPLEFNFITRPEEASMRSSLRMLSEMECLTSSFALTDRGRLFNNLPFDPKLSHFVLLAHEDFDQGSAAAVIAAIISAPGSILFFGNSKDDHHVTKSTGFSSDLLLLKSIYEVWFAAGEVNNNENHCSLGHKVSKSVEGCRPCRDKHSQANNLNNKVLNFVKQTVTQVQNELKRLRSTDRCSPKMSAIYKEDTERVIGACLALSFPEQVCEYILPSNPTHGVYAISSDLKGQLSYSSVLRIESPGAKYIVTMSQTKLPSGLVLMDKAHRVVLGWLPEDDRQKVERLSLNTTECYKKENISGRYCSICRKYFKQLEDDGRQYARFVIFQYDAPTCKLSVFAPRANIVEVETLCEGLVKKTIDEDMSQEVVVNAFNGSATLTVAAGFRIKNIEAILEQPCRVHFLNPPVKSRQELFTWICKISGCASSDIIWYSFHNSGDKDDSQISSSTMGIAVFRLEDFAVTAKRCSRSVQTSFEHGSFRALVKSFDENLGPLFNSCDVNPVKFKIIKKISCQIRILNLPEAMDENKLRKLFKRNGIPNPSYMKVPNPVNGARNVIVNFVGKDKNNDILSAFQRIPELNSTFQITTPRLRLKSITTECQKKIWPAETIVFFKTCQEADNLFCLANKGDFEVDGSAVVIVSHPEVFLLEEHLKNIGPEYDVNSRIGRMRQDSRIGPGSTIGQEIRFFGNMTSKCDQAAKALKKALSPVQYFFRTKDKIIMGAELLANGKLQSWATEFSVFVEEQKNKDVFTGFYVYGEKYRQGQFMASLAEYYGEFSTRYHLLVLSPIASCLFRKGNSGEGELQKLIQDRKSDKVQISYQSYLSSIEIVVEQNTRRTPSAIIQDCVSAINLFLNNNDQKSAEARNCVYCGIRPGRTFRICGHPYCTECLQQATTSQISSISNKQYLTSAEARDMEEKFQELLGSCPSCKTPISIKDLGYALTKSSLKKVCSAFAKLQLLQDEHPMGVCPLPKCGTLIPKQNGYSNCSSCKHLTCTNCGIGKDDRHGGNTCEQYQKLLKDGTGIALLRSIISKAKEFARHHWERRVLHGYIENIDVNPGLEKGCMALQRYCSGIQRVGFNEFEHKSVFAWHGTPVEAIPAICDDGFDPRRRSGQVHGPGEYFGIDADTSIGYNKGCERLIVVQLIKCNAVSTIPNFCYVVNNPTDWSYSFTLPVLVITFGSSTLTPMSWIMSEKQHLPYPFEERSLPEEIPDPIVKVHTVRREYVRPTPKPQPQPFSYSSNPQVHSYQGSYGNTAASSSNTQPQKSKSRCTIL